MQGSTSPSSPTASLYLSISCLNLSSLSARVRNSNTRFLLKAFKNFPD